MLRRESGRPVPTWMGRRECRCPSGVRCPCDGKLCPQFSRRQCLESYSWEQVDVAARGPPHEVVILEIPVAATVTGKNVRVSWTKCSLSVKVDGNLLVGGELSAPIRVDEDSDTTWQMSTTDSGQNIVEVTLHKAGSGLWERCFTEPAPEPDAVATGMGAQAGDLQAAHADLMQLSKEELIQREIAAEARLTCAAQGRTSAEAAGGQ